MKQRSPRKRFRRRIGLRTPVWWIFGEFFFLLASPSQAQQAQGVTLLQIVSPSTIVIKDGRPVTFAIHGFVEFKSLAEAFPYIDSQSKRWPGQLDDAARLRLSRDLLHEAVESRVVSMTDERPLEALLTHTSEELKRTIAAVREPVPSGYFEAFLDVQKKWKHSLNCWSASPWISGRVLSNWYPIEEGIQLYGATYDTTEHFWQAVKYHPEVRVGQLTELLATFEKRILEKNDWNGWLAGLDDDPKTYLPNAYAVEFLRHNLTRERLRWFREQLSSHGLQPEERARQAQQRGDKAFRFSAFEEKIIWGDLADLFHLVYVFSVPDDAMRRTLSERHFDAVYLTGSSSLDPAMGQRRMGFISEEFRSLMLEIWRVKYLRMPRFREVIASIPTEIRLEHFLNDGDSPDIPIPIYVGYLNRIRELARQKP